MDGLRPNQQRVVDALAQGGGLRRTELGQRLGMSKGTLAGIVTELVGMGLVVENAAEQAPAGVGRPPRLLALTGRPRAVGAMSWANGIMTAAVVTLAGEVAVVHDQAIPANLDRAAMLERSHRLLARCAKQAGYSAAELVAVVLSIPAPFLRGQGFARGQSMTAAWLGADLVDALEDRFALPAFVENNANLAAL